MLIRFAILSLALSMLIWIEFEGAAWAAKHRTISKLHGYSGLKAKVDFQKTKKNGKKFQRFVVQAMNGMPLQTYTVRVNGNAVGALHTKANGKGKFELRSPAFLNSGAGN